MKPDPHIVVAGTTCTCGKVLDKTLTLYPSRRQGAGKGRWRLTCMPIARTARTIAREYKIACSAKCARAIRNQQALIRTVVGD